MSLLSLRSVLTKASREGYAVGAFNFFGLENLQGILQGAREQKAPVIVQVSVGAVRHMGIATIVGMTAGAAEDYQVPTVLHLDHATDFDFIKKCVDAGFSSVMIDASAKPFRENIALSAKVVDYASRKGCSVEAELGVLGGKEEHLDVQERDAFFTNPQVVPEFVRATGVDALAVAVGTAHGFYKQAPRIDFERIGNIRAATDTPLVLHGGTGLSAQDFREAVRRGIAKINVGTELMLVGYGATLKREASAMPDLSDPRPVMASVREACAAIVSEKIRIFGSDNKA